ncbi:hypothetical protein BC939DRAFT_480769 [Gamsiella multidivaricata]|uniref:uncharacterized protein n=1 Tax=Gamsiella multidivaricata TaxID=101098 RepID=UPI00221FA7EF|nr:uncharacterized protein BC939DRAFT_480769 [Gamsiella multidivaricata]KAG0352420.1 hypothetical protein BGZ54_002793 [Gamsiella multidivaricata]KAI7817907.1 hypothetical protein BC939DRAFT_480769 [Gamsiella multidivaricata]
MFTLTARYAAELTFSIESPVLTTTPPSNAARIVTSQTNCDETVALIREGEFLNLIIRWYRHPGYSPGLNSHSYRFLHIVPRTRGGAVITTIINNRALEGRIPIKGRVKVNAVLHKDKYCFDIVLSFSRELTRKLDYPDADLSIRDTMKVLLKDMGSANVCFVFESGKDKARLYYGLWAHRAILSRFIRFTQSIKDELEDVTKGLPPPYGISEDDSRELLTVPMHGFTLATFCVLLRYIYTDEINLSVDASQYAISTTKSHALWRILDGPEEMGLQWERQQQEPVRWSSPSRNSLKLVDVTWEELLVVADHYNMEGLRLKCEDAVIHAINKNNVVKTLFTIGDKFESVKESALDYIVKNMPEMLLEGADPFQSYKHMPACHNIILELMRRKAASV